MVVNARMSDRKYRVHSHTPRGKAHRASSASLSKFFHDAMAPTTAAEAMPGDGRSEQPDALAHEDFSSLDTEEMQQCILEEARRQGLRRGYEEGQSQAQGELTAAMRAVQQAAAQIQQRTAEWLAQAEATVPDIALAIARKVMQVEVTTNEEVVRTAVREALAQMKDADLTLKLNPQDAAIVRTHLPELAQVAEHGTFVRLVEDPRIERGGCVVESQEGAVDAQPSSKLQQIERSFRDGL